MRPTIYALSSSSGRILTEKENVCVGISLPYEIKMALKNIQRQAAFRLFRAAETGFAGLSPRPFSPHGGKNNQFGEAHHTRSAGDLLQLAQLAFQLIFDASGPTRYG
jgi:alpha-D-ribose 1-methylphosphonate 5-triphosphate synthase subunit PhnG